MKRVLKYFIMLVAVLASVSCSTEIKDENENVYSFRMTAGTVSEGEDIPVSLLFSDAGLSVDNKSWGDPWKKAVFHGYVTDASGRKIDNVLFSGPDGVLTDGTRVDIGKSRRLDLVISHLRRGDYVLTVNMETRYTVDSWASTSFSVLEGKSQGHGGEKVFVESFTVPDGNSGFDIDPIGNVILDLRVFNASNPFRFVSTVSPANATDKRLAATPVTPSVLDASVEGENMIVIVPKIVGQSQINVRSLDGHATRSFGVKVIESPAPTTGFTLPTDPDGGDPDADFDMAGRLALEINDYAGSDGNVDPLKYYEYTCRPIPSTASKPSLMAESSDEKVVKAAIVDGNVLRLYPQGVGYANVTVSTTDGAIVRVLRVAVVSTVSISLTAKEGQPSAEDDLTGVFPCKIEIKSPSKFIPKALHLDVFGRATGRVDLTDKADYFLVDSLKNSRTAIYSFEEKVLVMCVPGMTSGYDVYSRLMSKISKRYVAYHHSDDYPRYYDDIKYFRLYSVGLQFGFVADYDTNLYRLSMKKEYDSPSTRIYQYLH